MGIINLKVKISEIILFCSVQLVQDYMFRIVITVDQYEEQELSYHDCGPLALINIWQNICYCIDPVKTMLRKIGDEC